jgi:hypothetical protein
MSRDVNRQSKVDAIWGTSFSVPNAILLSHGSGKTDAMLQFIRAQKWFSNARIINTTLTVPLDLDSRIFHGFHQFGHCMKRDHRPWGACGKGWRRPKREFT